MPKQFDLSATLPAGTTTSTIYTAKPNDNGFEGVCSAGPMPDPTTEVQMLVEVSKDGGTTWINVGGLDATGGLTGPKGGPFTTPVTASADTFYPDLQQGDKVRGQVIVTNPPAGGLPVSFVGNTF